MIRREALEALDCRVERQLAGEIECGVEQRASRGNEFFGDSDAVQSGSRVNAEADCHVDGVPAPEPPARELERLPHRRGGFAGTADQKYPECSQPVPLDPLGHFTNLRGVESFLELLQNRIGGALRRDAERSEPGRSHRREQIVGCDGGSKVGGVELHIELSPGDCFTYLEGVARRRVESRVDEIEVAYARTAIELFDLIRDELGVASSISPA